MKVRANATYIYDPCMLDVSDGRTNLKKGDVVRVKNLHGCPPCNTMGHAHVDHRKRANSSVWSVRPVSPRSKANFRDGSNGERVTNMTRLDRG